MAGDQRVEEISALVGRIYECTLEPSRWPAVLTEICALIQAETATLAVHHLHGHAHDFHVEIGTDPDYQDRFRQHYVGIAPFVVAANFVAPGDVKAVGDVIDYAEFTGGRFFREWAQPQGLNDMIVGILSKTAERMGYLGVAVPTQATAEQKATLKLLMPHIERAVRISDLLDYRAVESDNLAAVVDGLTAGVVQVDAGLAIRSANATADRLLRGGRGLAIANGRLLLPRGDGGALLRERIAQCAATWPARIESAPIMLAAPDGGMGLVCHVLPLPQRAPASAGGSAVAAIFLTDPVAPSVPPVEMLVRHFGLTPAETRVLLGLLAGQSPKEIADLHGLGIATIRTQLSNLFVKTGTAGQTELMAMLMKLRPPA